MTVAGLDNEVIAKELTYGFGLGGGLDDDQLETILFCHAVWNWLEMRRVVKG